MMLALAHSTLGEFRQPAYVEDLVSKLAVIGLGSPNDLALMSQGALEAKLSFDPTFTVEGMADAISIAKGAAQHSRPAPTPLGGGDGYSRGRRRPRDHQDTAAADVQMKQEEGEERALGQRQRSRSPRGRGGGGPPPPKPPLWLAAEQGDLEKARQLLEEGRDVDESYKGWTPLMKAAEENHRGIVELLLSGRADINATNKKGRTPLSFAAAPSGKRPVAKDAMQVLMSHPDIDLDKADDSGVTVFQRAKREKRDDALELLGGSGVTS